MLALCIEFLFLQSVSKQAHGHEGSTRMSFVQCNFTSYNIEQEVARSAMIEQQVTMMSCAELHLDSL
jgi:hypothetical protein